METTPNAVTTGADAIKQTESEGRENHCAVGSGGEQNTTEGKCNMSNSFSGFIDVLHENKKLPWSCDKNLIYKFVLLVYYFASVVYSITAALMKKDHIPFHIIYISISSFGLAVEIFVMAAQIKKLCILDKNKEEEKGLLNSTDAHMGKLPMDKTARLREYRRMALRIIVDYAVSSLGEFLIYPTSLHSVWIYQ